MLPVLRQSTTIKELTMFVSRLNPARLLEPAATAVSPRASLLPPLSSLLSRLLAIVLSAAMIAKAADPPPAADFYVAPDGNDAWSGKLPAAKTDGSDGPLASLQGARDAIRRLKAQGQLQKPIRVLFRGGTYRIAGPVVFTAEDSGTKEAPITYAAWPGEKPVASGGAPISGWKKGDGPVWTTVVPKVKEGSWYFRQLFVDGRRATPARLPNDDTFRAAGPGTELKDRKAARKDPAAKISLHYQNEDLKPWASLDDAVVVVYHSWTTSRHRIQSLDTKARLVEFTAPSGWPMGQWEKNQRYYVEFVREGLDAPGEWHLDRKTGVLSYYPRPGEDMTKAEVVAPLAEDLLRLEGDAATGKLVSYLRFDGLAFEHTDWIMPQAEPVDGQAMAGLKTAAVFARGARNCVFERCRIAHTGGYALWLQQGCKDNRVVQCHIHDLGGGGVRLGEVNLPPQPELQAERNEVINCFIHDGGRVYHGGIGVWIGRSSHNKVQHNEICDFLYTGVSVGWSWGYAPSSAHHNSIEYNHIHHLGWGQLSDMGGIYTLGISPGTRLCHNLIHDVLAYSYGGWGLYTDEGSTEILLENNVVYRTKDGCFHQHYGRENTVRNNILAFSATRGQIIRSRQEPHRSFTFEKNIVYYDQGDLLGGNWSDGHFLLESNCYWNAAGKVAFPGNLTLEAWQKKGQDAHSIVADPKLVNPKGFEFRLQPDSPAVKLGFQPIDTGQIGLTGPPEWVNQPKQIQRPRMLMPGEK
jgi:hypothetical protein